MRHEVTNDETTNLDFDAPPDEAKFSMLDATTMVVGSNSMKNVAWHKNLTRINLVGTKLFDTCCIQQVACY